MGAVEDRTAALQAQALQALQEAQQARQSATTLQHAFHQGLQHALQLLGETPSNNSAGQSAPVAAPGSRTRRPSRPPPSTSAPAAKRARLAAPTRGGAPKPANPAPASQQAPPAPHAAHAEAPASVPAAQGQAPVAPAESGELPPLEDGLGDPQEPSVVLLAAPTQSVGTSAGSPANSGGAAVDGLGAEAVRASQQPAASSGVRGGEATIRQLLARLDAEGAAAIGQAMADALTEGSADTAQCVRGTLLLPTMRE